MDEDILVIGAGPAGLAVSACLRARGLAHTVVERESSVAASWRRHYDRLALHTTKRYSALPFAPWPDTAPGYPSRDQVVEYLEAYAERFGIRPRLGVCVERVQREGERFTALTSQGALSPRFVVVASGANAVPVSPEFPGLEAFGGTVSHAGAYRNAAPYLGQRTLVVGCGNSGAEIALDLAEHHVDVSLVVRGPVHVVPRDVFGRPSQATGILLSRLPLGLRDALLSATLRLVVGDLSAWGIVRPKVGLNRSILETGRIPLLDLGTVAMIKAGRIKVVPAVEEVYPGAVRFADHLIRPFEHLILATGYRPGLERFIDAAATPEGRGRPASGAESGLPGLYFVGFGVTTTGVLRDISHEAPRVAAAIARAMA